MTRRTGQQAAGVPKLLFDCQGTPLFVFAFGYVFQNVCNREKRVFEMICSR